MRTEEEIRSEIKALKGQLDRIRRYSAFGDDNRAAVQAQIKVLDRYLDEDAIFDRWEGVDHTRDAALEARAWLDGDDLEEGGSPSGQWEGLCRPREEGEG